MRARYNGYTLPDGRWSISKTIVSNENEARQQLTVTQRVEIDGRLQATSAALIEAQYTLLSSAYASNGFDFTVFLPSGAISERLSLRATGAMGGVRVIQKPSLTSLENGQYVTYLPVKMVLEAEYPSALAGFLLSSFKETLHFSGGGPVLDWYRPIRGIPTQGIVRQADTYRVTQSGEATGFSGYPNLGTNSGAPPPIFGIGLLTKHPEVTLGSPEKRGLVYVNWPVSWTYEFESATPLLGAPNIWPL